MSTYLISERKENTMQTAFEKQQEEVARQRSIQNISITFSRDELDCLEDGMRLLENAVKNGDIEVDKAAFVRVCDKLLAAYLGGDDHGALPIKIRTRVSGGTMQYKIQSL